MKTWYPKTINAGSPHEQGLIIDEETGNNIAVAYDSKNTALLAAAPELLEALEAIESLPADDNGERVIPAGFLDKAREAIAQLQPKWPAFERLARKLQSRSIPQSFS